LEPLNDSQRERVESSMDIAYRAARNAAKKRPAHEHQLVSAASYGLMKAAESYDRLGVSSRMPWADWASLHANRSISDYFNSKFGSRFRREATSRLESDSPPMESLVDPKGDNEFQMVDICDLLAKIPTHKHRLLARRAVLDRATKREAGDDAGFPQGHGPRAWDRVARSLVVWGGIEE
jgi:hypothetical protein